MTRGTPAYRTFGMICCGLAFALQALPAFADAPLWVSTAKSTDQHPIEVARSGTGESYVLIVGSLAGNEPESLEMMEAACQLALKVPPPEPITLLFIRTLNPDGVREHVHTNGHGVDLNRNFPSPYFTSIPNRLTGPQPASEVETQYMVRVLEEYRPLRVIHIRSGVGDRPLVMVNRSWNSDDSPPVLPKDVNMGYFDRTFKAGSLEEYVTREIKGGVSTVLLPHKGSRQLQAAELLRFATSNLVATNTPETKPGPPTAPEGMTQATPNTDSQRIPGEVEFLATPPEYVATSQSASPQDQAGNRYFELPAPPR